MVVSDRCVVCEGAIGGEPRFANAWEKTRKTFPCCSDACAKAFDGDQHWIPARAPEPPDAAESRRLLAIAVDRLARDLPRVVVREMLQAGVSSEPLRAAVAHARGASSGSQRKAAGRSILGMIGMAIKGSGTLAESRDTRDAASFDAGIADLDRWDARFGTLGSR